MRFYVNKKQLPPISKDTDNHVLDKPDIFLDEIMRQAQESEIIRLTMDIRQGKGISYFKGKEIQVIPPEEVVSGMYTWADQILCATNKRKKEINDQMRAILGKGENSEEGDKIICRRNCWDILDISNENALINGTTGTIHNLKFDIKKYPINNFPKIPVIYADIKSELSGNFNNILIDKTAIETGNKFLTSEQEFQIYKRPSLKGTEPIELNYGYAITTHRAQGSQWNKILVFEENFPFLKEEHARWLYTACTRAVSRLVLVR